MKKKTIYDYTNPIDFFIDWRDKGDMSYKEMEECTAISSTFFYKMHSRQKDLAPESAMVVGCLMKLKGAELKYFMMITFMYRLVMSRKMRKEMLNRFIPVKYRRR